MTETSEKIIEPARKTGTAKLWKLIALTSFIAMIAALVLAGMLYTRKSIGDLFWPEDKIVSRYHRSLGLLMEAIRHTDRAYIFDNSGEHQQAVLFDHRDGQERDGDAGRTVGSRPRQCDDRRQNENAISP